MIILLKVFLQEKVCILSVTNGACPGRRSTAITNNLDCSTYVWASAATILLMGLMKPNADS